MTSFIKETAIRSGALILTTGILRAAATWKPESPFGDTMRWLTERTGGDPNKVYDPEVFFRDSIFEAIVLTLVTAAFVSWERSKRS